VSLKFDRPVIYLITKGVATAANFDEASAQILDIIRLAVEERVGLVQLREKALPARFLFRLTLAAVGLARDTETRILVNDRADIALAAGADGVHLTERSIPVEVIRRDFPIGFVVGVSTHTLETTKAAFDNGADFAVFGPVFETPGKSMACGTEKLAGICAEMADFPVIGIGGIDKTNYSSVIEAGAAGFAAIRSLNAADELRQISRQTQKWHQ